MRFAKHSRRAFIASAGALGLTPTAALAYDCAQTGCFNAARLFGGRAVDWADLIRRAQRFFGVKTPVYLVGSREMRASLPYFLPAQIGVSVGQIHIPDIYHIAIERQFSGGPHYIWHFIIGHEMAHAFQQNAGLIDALRLPYNSVVGSELHADFMAGFFLAREYGMQTQALDQLIAELRSLPSGPPGSEQYHGSPTQRFYMLSQGALMALRRPRPSRAQAASKGIETTFEIHPPKTSVRAPK